MRLTLLILCLCLPLFAGCAARGTVEPTKCCTCKKCPDDCGGGCCKK